MADSSSAALFPYYPHHHSSPLPLPLDNPQTPAAPPELQWTFESPEPPFPAISQPEPPGGPANPTPITPPCSSMAPASPSLCNPSCLLLREISHTNGLQIWKLQIHGGIGMVTHAVLEKLSSDFSLLPEYQTFDFCMESGSGVKQFLVGYFEGRKEEGYVVLEDPLWEFYDALSVGLGVGDFLDIDSFFELTPPIDSGSNQLNEQDMPNNQNDAPPPPPPGDGGNGSGSGEKPQKIPLSAQRERTGKLKVKDFAGYLHLPIEEAARRMNICPTVMKKICRRDGLVRWPYRKIRSIQRKIAARSKALSGVDPDERRRAHLEILDLQQQLAAISQAFLG